MQPASIAPRRPLHIGAPDPRLVARDVRRALEEDIGEGDASAALIPADRRGRAEVLAREALVLAGRDWFDGCIRALDADAHIEWTCTDGEQLPAGRVLCRIEASARALLSAERSALNFLQTLSGTATTTAAYVAALAGSRTRLLDTRKTLPGLRYAQKYAVRAGGAENHRLGLYDAILIKENHIIAAGGIAAAIAAARREAPTLEVEIEVETLAEYREALQARPDRIMLDELTPAELRSAIAERLPGIELELSGGVLRERLGELAQLGVDYISVGALTKHLHAIDLSLRWLP